jgi:hypothetical protein
MRAIAGCEVLPLHLRKAFFNAGVCAQSAKLNVGIPSKEDL